MLYTILIASVLLCSFSVLCADATPLKVGDAAPDAGAVDETGKGVKLSSFKGKSGVVVFFFPKADTPGCTKESCGFRDESKLYTDKGYVLLGASRDTPAELKAFKEKFKLNYSLLSDPKGELSTALGIKPGARQTVVIDKDGKVEKVYGQVSAASHAQDIAKDLKWK